MRLSVRPSVQKPIALDEVANRPVYLDEVAILHGLRTLHDWLLGTRTPQSSLYRVTIYAGDYVAVAAIGRWFRTGTLNLRSAAASPILEDIHRLPRWLEVNLSLLPYNLPMDVPRVEELPLIYQDVVMIFEEFRLYALPTLGDNWINTLPRAPLTKTEVKDVLREQLERDEILVLRQLAPLDSVSANIIIRLELTRELVRAALTMLQEERPAQVTLTKILSGARFKYLLDGVLVPTRCPNKYRGTDCGLEDSFDHLLSCYKLRSRIKKGAQVIGFLLLMARRARPPPPGLTRPLHL